MRVPNGKPTIAFAALTALLAGTTPSFANEPSVEDLQRQIEDLDQKLRIIERTRELENEQADARARSLPSVSLGAGGFSVRSADTNFLFRIRGGLQADARFFIDDTGAANDTFLLRRVRPSLEGTVWNKFDFRVVPDFAGNNFTLMDAYADLRFSPYFSVLAGKTKSPFGLERLVPQVAMPFIERGLPTHLAPNRDIGIQVRGSLLDQRLSYTVAVLNGTPYGGSSVSDLDDDKEFAGRLFAHPFRNSEPKVLRGLGFGVAVTYGDKSGTVPASYNTVNQQRFFQFNNGVVNDGLNWRLGPQAYYYYGPFGLLAEYTISSQELRAAGGERATIENDSWQVAISYVVTGENASYRGVAPAKNFNPSEKTWGALEVVARYGELDIDDAAFPLFADPAVSANQVRTAGFGLNWYLNRNVKLSANYNWSGFDGPVVAPNIGSKDEHAIFSRVQLTF
jgi:phosphate-selective porin OprO and OprP